MEEKPEKVYSFSRMGRQGIHLNDVGYKKKESELNSEEIDCLFLELKFQYNQMPVKVREMFCRKLKDAKHI